MAVTTPRDENKPTNPPSDPPQPGQEEAKPAETPHKLTKAELEAVEEENNRRKYMYPQKETPLVVSANEPDRPELSEVLADMNYPASKGDIVTRVRNKGMHQEVRYAAERMEDRLYVDFKDVEAGLRAAG